METSAAAREPAKNPKAGFLRFMRKKSIDKSFLNIFLVFPKKWNFLLHNKFKQS